jgi:putative acetyltransferase
VSTPSGAAIGRAALMERLGGQGIRSVARTAPLRCSIVSVVLSGRAMHHALNVGMGVAGEPATGAQRAGKGMHRERIGLILRYADAADLAALRVVYARAVDELAAKHYSVDQRRVWASFAWSNGFVPFVRDVDTLVAAREGRIEGFCGIGADGHVASLYVIGAAAGRGLGTRLLGQALRDHPAPASGRYFAETNLLSRPLFLKLGFTQIGTERVIREGVAFQRFRVERAMATPVQDEGARTPTP